MMMIENKIQHKKIKYQKSYRKLFLNLEKNFFSILNKINDIFDMKMLKYLLKEFLKLHTFLLNIRNKILFYKEKLIIIIIIIIIILLLFLQLKCMQFKTMTSV